MNLCIEWMKCELKTGWIASKIQCWKNEANENQINTNQALYSHMHTCITKMWSYPSKRMQKKTRTHKLNGNDKIMWKGRNVRDFHWIHLRVAFFSLFRRQCCNMRLKFYKMKLQMVLHFGDFRRKRSDECGFDDDTCVREWIQPRPFSFNQSPLPSAHFYDVPIDNFISMLNVICCQYAAEKKHMFHFASSSLIMIQFVIIAMILSFLSGASQYEKKK